MMKIILEDNEAETYILSRQIGELKYLVNELKGMHDGLRKCNRFELSDLCNKINNILDTIATDVNLHKIVELTMSTRNELSD